jgi:hypothetical protein
MIGRRSKSIKTMPQPATCGRSHLPACQLNRFNGVFVEKGISQTAANSKWCYFCPLVSFPD